MAHSKTATLNDLNLLNELLCLSKAYWGYDKAFMEKFMDELSVKSHHIDSGLTKLCYTNDKLIGFYTFVITGLWPFLKITGRVDKTLRDY